jgi:hypothetical protein
MRDLKNVFSHHLIVCFLCIFKVFARAKLTQQLDDWREQLPVVTLLLLPSVDWPNLQIKADKFSLCVKQSRARSQDNYVNASNNENVDDPQSCQVHFDLEVMFIAFLTKFYHKTVLYTSWDRDNNESINRNVFQQNTLHFIATAPKHGLYTLQHWKSIDQEISMQTNISSTKFILNRSFMVESWPNITSVIKGVRSGCRNVLDVYHIRLTNHLTISDRNLLLPFYSANAFSNLLKQTLDRKNKDGWRKNFIFYAGLIHDKQESSIPSATMEIDKYNDMLVENRDFEELLFNFWKLYHGPYKKNSKILTRISQKDWNDHVANSNFCFVLSGTKVKLPSKKQSTNYDDKLVFRFGSTIQNLFTFLSMDCIPVLFVASYTDLPLPSFIKWSEIAVLVYQDILFDHDQMSSLLDHLKSVNLETFRKNIIDVKTMLDYRRFEWPSIYHLSLLELNRNMNEGNEYFIQF